MKAITCMNCGHTSETRPNVKFCCNCGDALFSPQVFLFADLFAERLQGFRFTRNEAKWLTLKVTQSLAERTD